VAPEPPGRLSFFAATLPGLGPLLRDEAAAHSGLDPDDETGFDGRADTVFFRVRRGARFRLDDLRLAEDVFVAISAARRGPPARVAASLITPTDLERALSARVSYVGHLSPSMTFRVITRVLDESQFKRTELRGAVERVVGAARPRWRIADPAELEVWVVEHRRARFVSGLRLSGKRLRQHGEGRASERHGALRPVVAAAMVRLAGARRGHVADAGPEPAAEAGPRRLLDPYCGSGTIVSEAMAAGWEAQGSDVDTEAVRAARANVAGADIQRADALHLRHPDGAFDAVVTNVPFGRQFDTGADRVAGSSARRSPAGGLRSALREAARVTRRGGRVIVLVPPPVPEHIAGLTLVGSYPIRLLGVPARIWAFDRDQQVATGGGAAG
jgi:23S rRNA G2445 N2-methylase RlmL